MFYICVVKLSLILILGINGTGIGKVDIRRNKINVIYGTSTQGGIFLQSMYSATLIESNTVELR